LSAEINAVAGNSNDVFEIAVYDSSHTEINNNRFHTSTGGYVTKSITFVAPSSTIYVDFYQYNQSGSSTMRVDSVDVQ
jgi:hypothetical protein